MPSVFYFAQIAIENSIGKKENQQKSKCIKVCKLDSTRSYCIGCFRSIEEIIEAGRNAKKDMS